ncbi:MAG: hypothetical protein COX83_03585 [Candidatus Magasanikbacteria bacterium CG_4_10_14_0_2_um_filter_41_31]|uniref:Citrate transporter-like domain-containing protein n=1 Tax=Candidatus Magasanikbacteria bacterium CG_4_10_14_0_2_um_filter_41_31 TaxID=1974639 RepID=A0A2M7V2U0_9BACT|nr:MAG: hypothetical protein COX83_03585 [Candidatus Magasanikbacteria bacterium CG_4_10_14_0_2_um_filter_41_31]
MQTLSIMALAIFLLSYIVIISEKFHRTVVALSGAALMVLLGILTQDQALEGIDFNTLGLLIGMMVIVGIAKESGMFQYVAIRAAKIAKGKPIAIFLLLGLITGVFSAFLDNVTTVFLMVPVTFVITNNLHIDPKAYLVGIILFSNIGGAATLIGDPPNILIGSTSGLTFNDFLFNLGPVALLSFVVVMLFLLVKYRHAFVTTDEHRANIMKFNPKEALTDIPLLVKSLIVFALVFVGFLTHAVTHIEVATIALAGAAFLLLLTLNDPEDHLREVEWGTIFFFAGLFVLVTGIERAGIIEVAANWMLSVTAGNLSITTLAILWGSAIASAIVDNIPFVATMIPLVKEISAAGHIVDPAPLWWALAIGADFGGNATIIGASANVVVKGMAEKAGHHIGFFEYMKVAVPVTLFVLLASTAYVFLRYLA